MDDFPSSSRRRTFELPKSSPDAGLAEWASKIKAIQQEVDRDEEDEQRRLQEEIAQSRLDRARRRNTATGSIDWTKKAPPPMNEPLGDTKATVDKQQHQADALHKLSGSTSPPRSFPALAASTSPADPSAPKTEGMSLAAFIGGRATGPRLNKPAPQQDSHDPTLFEQSRREGPHPIFGRVNEATRAPVGRFASKAQPYTETQDLSIDSKPSAPKPSTYSDDTIGRPSVPPTEQNAGKIIKSSPELPRKPDLLRKPSDKVVSNAEMRREVGVPHPATPPDIPTKPKVLRSHSQEQELASGVPSRSSIVSAPPKPTSLAEMIGGRASGPRLTRHPSGEPVDVFSSSSSSSSLFTQGRAIPGIGNANRLNSPSMASSTSPKPMSSRSASQQAATGSIPPLKPDSPQKRSFSGSTIVTPSLARPLQPQAVAQPSPIAAASAAPSPAFLRVTPTTQDLHPSLSRLQGRGFVEQRVKATSKLYGDDASPQSDRSASPGSSGKRPSVLDRWQPAAASPPSSPPAPNPSKPPVRRETTNVATASTPVQQPIRPRTISPALIKPRIEEERQAVAPVRLPGMATASSFPLKQRQYADSSVEAGPAGGEIGDGGAIHQANKLGATTPLSHPTRDRARKPRKASGPSKASPHVKPREDNIVESDAVVEVPQISIQTTGGPQDVHEVTEPQQLRRVPSPETRYQISPAAADNLQQLKDSLVYQPSARVDMSFSPPQTVEAKSMSNLAADKCALSNGTETQLTPIVTPRPKTPESPSSSSDEVPQTPSRHSRIPTTGQRATVMDVAQALQQHEQHIRESSWTPEPELPETADPREDPSAQEEVDEIPRTDVKAAIAGWGRNFGPVGQHPERRRSSYDRVATLPPLVEVKTPAATPQGSLSRGSTQVEQPPPRTQDIHQHLQERSPLKDFVSDVDAPRASVEVRVETVHEPELEPMQEKEDHLVYIEHHDKLPPPFNLQSILKEVPFSPDLSSQTISVDILCISGNTATAVTREPNVFYDTDVIVVIHRLKEKMGQLVSNKVWIWRGKRAEFTEKEECKAREIAERFHTTGTHCSQGSEPPDFIHTLGGVLAIREGIRAHWSMENTTMHRVHRVGDSMFVDEVDLELSNLCSAYSYCLSVLGTSYVWHGRGASEDERKVALAYGQSLTATSSNLVELEEGADDLWMVLGEGDYAKADHWKFRSRLDRLGARLYIIDCARTKIPVQPLENISALDLPNDGVFVMDCRLEIFVVVTAAARGKRTDIQLALFVAGNVSAAGAAKRPFEPPIHVVILPSKLPMELRASLRFCNEKALNAGSIPNHMNILTLSEAMDHMQQCSWPKSLLADPNFLPLGVDPNVV